LFLEFFAMKYFRAALYLAVAVAILAWASPGDAQTVTTGTITGLVQDAQGGVLPGVTVTAVHTPTGTSYEGLTQGDGRFSLLNVRVGGPYRLTATLGGFRNAVIGDLNVRLGEATDVPVKMQLANVTETVVVSADVSPVFTGSHSGVTENIGTAAIENLPTINRSLQDIARTSPYFNQIASDNFPSALSVAGRNVRYNSIQIDGAVNNDVFSIASGAGTPGGSAETQPISFDVIQELQLVVSPYDVRQGQFSGGGINAITRSGTNQVRGSTFYVFRDESMVGTGVDNKAIATFSDKQFGGTFGGPIVQNKAFFLGNAEWGRKDTPSGFSVSGTSGASFGHLAEAQRIRDIAMQQYGFDPGGFDESIRKTDNNKVFVRTDFNLGRSQLTVRHNYVDGFNDIGGQSNVTYRFPSNFYRQHSKTNSTVGQFNSRLGTGVNEFRATYQRIRDFRTFDDRFPFVQIRIPDGTNFNLGTENSSHANELDQDTFELHDDYTLVRGSHTYTFGTHNEFFKFRNLFIQNLFGNYEFSSIDMFAAGTSQAFSHGFSLTSDPEQAARFKVYQFGLYVGDQWRVRPDLTLTYGVRWDKPYFPDTPTANQTAADKYGYKTDIVPSPQSWSPRIGANWDLSGDGPRQQVRGGIGYFSGRNPFVYLSNQYGNTGIEFRRLSASFAAANRFTFSPDPDNQSESVGTAALNEVDVIDPDYQFPSIVRGNLAYDRDLPFGIIGNVELLFSNTVRDVNYSNLNLVQTGTRLDGRPVFSKVDALTYSDVILLRNTDQGNNWNITTQLERRFRSGWFARGAYSYGRSNSISDTTNSTARSTWANVYTSGNINDAPIAVSNFDLRHRIVLSGSYNFDVSKAGVTLSMYYNGQTGRPYSYNFGTDINGDGVTTNDLLYYPLESQVTISTTGLTYADLVTFLETGDCKDLTPGTIFTRNSCRMPFVHDLDFRAAVNVPIGRFKPEFTVDVLNLMNLFDRTQGQVLYAAFNDLLVANASEAAGKYTYAINSVARPNAVRFSRDDLRSRWQAQIGLRLRF
jgi:hypothetical protein